jgi:thiamine transporter
MKRESVVKTMAEIAIFSSLGFVLDIVASVYSKAAFVNGGSIGIAMAAIFFMSFHRGLVPGLITGLIIGLLQMAGGVYAISDTGWKVFLQVALDYWLAYPLCGFAGLLHKPFQNAQTKKAKISFMIIGCVIGGLLKYLCHFLSGVLFWPNVDNIWGMGESVWFSVVYNGAYMIPCIILSTVVMVILYCRVPTIFTDPDNYNFGKKKTDDDNNNETK